MVLVRTEVEEVVAQGLSTILHKKEQKVGERKIESKIWEFICKVLSHIWYMGSLCIHI